MSAGLTANRQTKLAAGKAGAKRGPSGNHEAHETTAHSARSLTFSVLCVSATQAPKITVLNVGRLARFGRGTCPETPRRDVVCGIPKRPTFALIFLTSSGGGVS